MQAETFPFVVLDYLLVNDEIDYSLAAEKIFPPGCSVIDRATWRDRVIEVWCQIQQEKKYYRFSKMFEETEQISSELINRGLVKIENNMYIRNFGGPNEIGK